MVEVKLLIATTPWNERICSQHVVGVLVYVEGVIAWAQVAPILMREKSRRAREGGAADVAKDSYEKVPVEVGDSQGWR